jgi:deoxyribodipyrimidine photolyase-related protein
MREIAAYFLEQVELCQIEPIDLATVKKGLFILHDQLNLANFPKQILESKPLLIFVESFAYAKAIPHHKKKLTYILSAQRHFVVECSKAGYQVINLYTNDFHAQALREFLTENSNCRLTYMQPSEWDTRKSIELLEQEFAPRVEKIENSFFLAELDLFKPKIAQVHKTPAKTPAKSKGYRLETFYRQMRKSTGYLMLDDQPVGGKWNYDQENRKKLAKGEIIPAIAAIEPDQITAEVIAEIDEYLPHHFGNLTNSKIGFNYAVTREQALRLAQEFVSKRLAKFGDYEDALKSGEPFLFHSVLSIYLNNGLLLPGELCEMAIAAYQDGTAPLNSVEGFVRQILGWREFIRVYYEAMMPEVRSSNHFGFKLNLPQMYWDGKTDLACLQSAIANVIDYGYSHHIQRLMVLSNFSNLTFTDPALLNNWFWFAYIDAYEWVELPNVLGMATFADGGILASKPYVSSGNYINKMGDHCRNCRYDVQQKTGENACPFNYLYWNFVDTFREDFNENGRVSLMTNMFEKKSDTEKQQIKDSAQMFIQNLDRHQ